MTGSNWNLKKWHRNEAGVPVLDATGKGILPQEFNELAVSLTPRQLEQLQTAIVAYHEVASQPGRYVCSNRLTDVNPELRNYTQDLETWDEIERLGLHQDYIPISEFRKQRGIPEPKSE